MAIDPRDPAEGDRPVPDDSASAASGDIDHGRDPETAREGLELELMDQDESEVGEHIGEHNPGLRG